LIDTGKMHSATGVYLSNKYICYMANIPQLRAVLMYDVTQGAWIQPLVVVYWPYHKPPRFLISIINWLPT
jgi:hypothetical protein